MTSVFRRLISMRAHDYIGNRLDEKTQSWIETIRRDIRPRPNLVLELNRAALLVVDMLQYFTDPSGRCYLPASRHIVPNITHLLQLMRRHLRPIVFTRHCHDGEHDLGMLGKFFSDYIKEGLPEAQIIEPLSPQKNEIVFEKKTYDAFYDTPLLDVLTRLGVSQVIITGVLTHMCCETTARSAFCRGFEVYLPVDALATTSEQLHLGSLFSLSDSVAIPTSTNEILNV